MKKGAHKEVLRLLRKLIAKESLNDLTLLSDEPTN